MLFSLWPRFGTGTDRTHRCISRKESCVHLLSQQDDHQFVTFTAEQNVLCYLEGFEDSNCGNENVPQAPDCEHYNLVPSDQ